MQEDAVARAVGVAVEVEQDIDPVGGDRVGDLGVAPRADVEYGGAIGRRAGVELGKSLPARLCSYGPRSYDQYSYDRYSHGPYSYGLCSYGLHSDGPYGYGPSGYGSHSAAI